MKNYQCFISEDTLTIALYKVIYVNDFTKKLIKITFNKRLYLLKKYNEAFASLRIYNDAFYSTSFQHKEINPSLFDKIYKIVLNNIES